MTKLRTTALFAGIGGLESGLKDVSRPLLFCECDPGASRVLRVRFPQTEIVSDVRDLDSLPQGTELLTAGFPCQDLSQAGETRGIEGTRSGLVGEVFRLLRSSRVPWLILENVPFMLQLERGAAMRFVANALEELGYRWAYRVVDTRAFGLPQRRQRVFLVASNVCDPSELLFQTDVPTLEGKDYKDRSCGFYWTEGVRGLGWAVNAIPTLKGGSTIGIPSPPAIWLTDGRIVTPDIRDGERLQGFDPDWTKPAEDVVKPGARWRLIGNAVSVPASAWLSNCLKNSPRPYAGIPLPFDQQKSWPRAAFGSAEHGRFEVEVSMWPVRVPVPRLERFLQFEPHLLSFKATRGFLRRLESSRLRYPEQFRQALDEHLSRMCSQMGERFLRTNPHPRKIRAR